ncbi:hypothetical protein L3Q82_004867 [Scortum barcoo]|uniref:Uncharacterized protein n=1 Tax=Scortum barcoo TaxID=214431 RepID=A0ACB8VE49_9TELE|nr:hypothetical protein L3Q82_004867 [Scortum barcoo]
MVGFLLPGGLPTLGPGPALTSPEIEPGPRENLERDVSVAGRLSGLSLMISFLKEAGAQCFERIVLKHIKDIIPAGLDQYQFTYRENRSTEDAVSIALHTALTHLQLPNTYVRMLFVDFSSAFNTVIPDKLILKLHNLGLPSSLCHWIRDFLTNRPQVVRIGDNTSSTLVLSTGTPQGCVLSPALFTLFTSDCSAIHSTNIHRESLQTTPP